MSSYVLFTLDKLVQKVVKQVQLVLQEEQSHRLVELWRYEAARGVPVSAHPAGPAWGLCLRPAPWIEPQGTPPRAALPVPAWGAAAPPAACASCRRMAAPEPQPACSNQPADG